MSIKVKHILTCFLISTLFINTMFFHGLAQEETGNIYYVDSNYWEFPEKGTAEQPFKTIQAAIDYASDGDTLYIFGGLYKEHIVIDKKLHLWGGVEGKELKESVIKVKSDNRYSVEIIADYVKFQDFYLTDEDDYKTSPIGSLIYIKAENVVINGNTFNNTDSYGIFIDSDGDGTIISGNRINNTKKGVYVESSTNDIVNNFITNCSDAGIHLYSTAHNRLFDNKIDTCLNGIKGESCTYLNISNNTFSGNEYNAIKLILCTQPLIRFNDIKSNPFFGIFLDSNKGTISDNLFNNNNRGISLEGTSNIIQSNTFTYCNGSGIFALSKSNLNIMYNNTFENNGKTAEENGDNTWYDETTQKGNYWDDYEWLDRNKDGIGDSQYNKNGLIDPYPLGFFLKIPDKPYMPNPEDSETGVGLKPTLKVKVVDEDSETLTVTFYNAETGDKLGTDKKIISGKYAEWDLTLPFDRTYAWYAIANDSLQENKSDTFFLQQWSRHQTIFPQLQT